MGSTGANFHIKRLEEGAALGGPVVLQFEDDLLEGEHGCVEKLEKIMAVLYLVCRLNKTKPKAT